MRHVAEIPDIGFAAPVGLPPGLEVMTLADLRGRSAVRMGADFMRPLRPRFHHLVALQRGRLRQTVDFTGYDLEPGTWLWVRPGQVHQWGDLTGADGALIVFEQGFLDPATSAYLADPHGTVVRVPGEADQEALGAATSALEREFRTPPGVQMVRVNPDTGEPASAGTPGILAGFKAGTEPGKERASRPAGGVTAAMPVRASPASGTGGLY